MRVSGSHSYALLFLLKHLLLRLYRSSKDGAFSHVTCLLQLYLCLRVVSRKARVNNRYIDMEDTSFRASNTNRPLPAPPERCSTYETVPADNQKTSTTNTAFCNTSAPNNGKAEWNYSVSQKNPLWGLVAIFPKRSGIFQPNFTRSLCVPIYASLPIFIHLTVMWRFCFFVALCIF